MQREDRERKRVCVCEREREREKEKSTLRGRNLYQKIVKEIKSFFYFVKIFSLSP